MPMCSKSPGTSTSPTDTLAANSNSPASSKAADSAPRHSPARASVNTIATTDSTARASATTRFCPAPTMITPSTAITPIKIQAKRLWRVTKEFGHSTHTATSGSAAMAPSMDAN